MTTTNTLPRYATELKKFKCGIDYDVLRGGLSDLPLLDRAQLKRLLDELIAPNLADLRAWLGTLGEMKKTLEAELKTFTKRRLKSHEVDRKLEIRTSIRQVHDGLWHDGIEEGIAAKDYTLLEPLRTRLGQWGTARQIAKLERDQAYIVAYCKRWPTPEATQPYRYLLEEGYLPDGTEIEMGYVVQFTEGQSRSCANIYGAVDEPAAISRYKFALLHDHEEDDDFN